MAPLDTSDARPIPSAGDFERLLREAEGRPDLIVALYRKSSGKQTVSFHALLETAMCHGWVDTQTKRIDDERYAIRYVPRRPGSNWSPRNRAIARRLVLEGRDDGRGPRDAAAGPMTGRRPRRAPGGPGRGGSGRARQRAGTSCRSSPVHAPGGARHARGPRPSAAPTGRGWPARMASKVASSRAGSSSLCLSSATHSAWS